MPNIDPKIAFWLGIFLCVVAVIANGGATVLQGTMPETAIAIVVAWCKLINGVGTAVMTYIAGTNMTQSGRISNVETLPLNTRAKALADSDPHRVAAVVLTSQAEADSVDSAKVVGPEEVQVKRAA